MKLSLLHKGLILVSIPLCFEVTIFGYLIHLQDEVEHESQRVNRNKKINDAINVIVTDVIGITDTMESYSIKPGAPDQGLATRLAKVKANMNAITDTFGTLRTLAKGDPVTLEKIEACARGFRLARQDLFALRDAIRSTPFDQITGVLHFFRRKLSDDMHMSLNSGLLELGAQSLKGTDDIAARQIREQERLLLKCALGASVLIASLVAAYVSSDLASRLIRLSVNAEKLRRTNLCLA